MAFPAKSATLNRNSVDGFAPLFDGQNFHAREDRRKAHPTQANGAFAILGRSVSFVVVVVKDDNCLLALEWMDPMIEYSRTLEAVDWTELKSDLAADHFDNGRTPEQLRRSFANSHQTCIALVEGRVIGTARVLSDGVCNAYLVDLWTLSAYRRQGIATELVQRLLADLPGQHVYLQCDEENLPFYEKLGFAPQPHGLSRVVGRWLDGRKPKPVAR